MARYFDTDKITIADNAALSFGTDVDGDGPFSFAFWIRYDANAESGTQFVLGWGNWLATPSFNIITYGAAGAFPGRLLINIEGTNGANAQLVTDTAMNDGAWHHVAIVFDGTVLRAYIDGTVETTTTTKADLDRVDVAEVWNFGVRSLGYSWLQTTYLAEWAKWDVALSSEQITALAAGVRPPEVGTRPAWYIPMLAGLDEEIAGLVATNNGSTIAEHPPAIICPGIPHVLRPIWPAIAGPYQVLAAATHASGTAEGQIFSTGTTIGQVNEQ